MGGRDNPIKGTQAATDGVTTKVNNEQDQVSDSLLAATQTVNKSRNVNHQNENRDTESPIKPAGKRGTTSPNLSDAGALDTKTSKSRSSDRYALPPGDGSQPLATRTVDQKDRYASNPIFIQTLNKTAEAKPTSIDAKKQFETPNSTSTKIVDTDPTTPVGKLRTAKKDKDEFNPQEQHVGPGTSPSSSEKSLEQQTALKAKPPGGSSSNSGSELAKLAVPPKEMPLASPIFKPTEASGPSANNQPADKGWSQFGQKYTGERNLAWAGAPSNKDGGGDTGKQKFEPGFSGQHKDEGTQHQGTADNAGWSAKDNSGSKSHENKAASDNAGSNNSYSRDQGHEHNQGKQESNRAETPREDSHGFNSTKLASVDGIKTMQSPESGRTQESMHAREAGKNTDVSHGGNGVDAKDIHSADSSARSGLSGRDHAMAPESASADKMARTSLPGSSDVAGKQNSGDTVSGGKDKKGFDVAPGEQSTVEAKGGGKFGTNEGIGGGKAGDKFDALHDLMTNGDGKGGGKGGFVEDPRFAFLNDSKGRSFDDKSIFAGLKGLGDGTGLSGKHQDSNIVSTSLSMLGSLINAAQEKIIKSINIPSISEASLIGLPLDNSVKLSNQISGKPFTLGDSLDPRIPIIKNSNSNEPINKDLSVKDTPVKDLVKNQIGQEPIGKEAIVRDLGAKEVGTKDPSVKDSGMKESGLDSLTPKLGLEPKGPSLQDSNVASIRDGKGFGIDPSGREGNRPDGRDIKGGPPDGRIDGRSIGPDGKAISDEKKPQDIRSSIDALLGTLAAGITPAVKIGEIQVEQAMNWNNKIPQAKEQLDDFDPKAESSPVTSEPVSQSKHDTASRKKYVVKPIDTISSIANSILGDARYANLLITINRANVEVVTRNLKEVVILRPGQSLLLPSLNEMEVHQKAYFPAPASTES